MATIATKPENISTQEQIIREAPEIEAYKLGLLESAKKLAESPMELPAYQAAPLSQLQQGAMGLAQQGIGSYAPFLQAGQQAVQAGIGTLGVGAQQAAGVNVAPQYQQAQLAQQYGLDIASQLPYLAGQAGGGYGDIAQGAATISGATQALPSYLQANLRPSQNMLGQAAMGTAGGVGG